MTTSSKSSTPKPAKKASGTTQVKKVARKGPIAKKAPVKSPSKSATRTPADDPWSSFRLQALTSVFSGSDLAKAVGVSPSQPSRWASGQERPGPAAGSALIDLEAILARARLIWGPNAARIWLESPNAFLGGARPLDVLRLEGSAPVLQALDAETWGGAA
ncbi:antitoxin Xre/MbcA/ParS toxin-binding domain-containing protein [Gordonia lacunae]|uniref:antitoxin Xre/MbcA/ParS toxin-binding domain-containing protein n=1 Tax=Gordonia TaxID=2053 RepID=UPI002009E480|nr:antitoxin Xre/MbcA/ParS toxin-binding domain-containing protein [Gordonia terrae]UPW11950.1 MbcA/ParS/Xre antitoxin family protein [Gordonia terrae]